MSILYVYPLQGNEQYCQSGAVFTYNGNYKYPHCSEYTSDGGNITYGRQCATRLMYVDNAPTLSFDFFISIPLSLHAHITGGYSKHIVVHKDFTVIIPKNIDLAAATPLLCAGKACD